MPNVSISMTEDFQQKAFEVAKESHQGFAPYVRSLILKDIQEKEDRAFKMSQANQRGE